MASGCDSKSTQFPYEVEIKNNITEVKISESYVDKLTEQQQKMLKKLEETFAYRYTDEDKDYIATKQSTIPPLVPSYRPFCNRRSDNRSRPYKRSRDDKPFYSSKRTYSQNETSNYNDYRR